LLRLEDSIDALSANDLLPGVIENEWRILTIEYYNVDLLTELIPAVDDVSLLGAVTRGQVGLKQFEPDILAAVALRAGMA